MGKLLLAVLLACVSSAAAVQAQTVAPPAGIPARAELLPEKPQILLGEPTFVTFRVHNPTKQDWTVMVGGDYRNQYGRPESFKLSAAGPQGENIPQLEAGFQFGGMIQMLKIPAGSYYDFKLFLPHWLPLKTTGKYSITARRTLQLEGDTQFHTPPSSNSKVAIEATAVIEVLPYNFKEYGTLIDEWGRSLFATHQPGENLENGSLNKLTQIQDVRALPFLIRGSKLSSNSSIQAGSVVALAKYDDDRAVQALKVALNAEAKDIGPMWSNKEDGVSWLRQFAASSLSRNPNPKAVPVLLTHHNDPSVGVRLTVLQRAAQLPPAQAEPVIQARLQDPDEIVRGEAERFWKLLHPQPA